MDLQGQGAHGFRDGPAQRDFRGGQVQGHHRLGPAGHAAGTGEARTRGMGHDTGHAQALGVQLEFQEAVREVVQGHLQARGQPAGKAQPACQAQAVGLQAAVEDRAPPAVESQVAVEGGAVLVQLQPDAFQAYGRMRAARGGQAGLGDRMGCGGGCRGGGTGGRCCGGRRSGGHRRVFLPGGGQLLRIGQEDLAQHAPYRGLRRLPVLHKTSGHGKGNGLVVLHQVALDVVIQLPARGSGREIEVHAYAGQVGRQMQQGPQAQAGGIAQETERTAAAFHQQVLQVQHGRPLSGGQIADKACLQLAAHVPETAQMQHAGKVARAQGRGVPGLEGEIALVYLYLEGTGQQAVQPGQGSGIAAAAPGGGGKLAQIQCGQRQAAGQHGILQGHVLQLQPPLQQGRQAGPQPGRAHGDVQLLAADAHVVGLDGRRQPGEPDGSDMQGEPRAPGEVFQQGMGDGHGIVLHIDHGRAGQQEDAQQQGCQTAEEKTQAAGWFGHGRKAD